MNSPNGWQLYVDPGVLKSLARFPARNCERIGEAIRLLSMDPYVGDIEKMKGEKNTWRRRVGSYRIFFDIAARRRLVHVYKVERRTTTTY